MLKEHWQRSLLKALTYRLQNTLATMTVVYLLTGKLVTTVSVGLFEIIFKPFLYLAHERIWNNISFGKKEHKPFVLWFTGLPLSGKSLIADAIYIHLKKRKFKVQRLDGDDIKSLFPVQGFTPDERSAYIKRMGYFSKILNNHGISVIASFISPTEESRSYVRKTIGENFVEIYVSTPKEFCEKNDQWGMYEKARRGEIEHFVGVNQQYEIPENPEIIVDMSVSDIHKAVKVIRKFLKNIY